MAKREKNRDDRDFDTTQLKVVGHGRTLHRDYSAHFFRWSFARRFINAKTNVLEIGCGEEKPLSKILTGGTAAHVNKYVGVDIHRLKESNSQRLTFLGEFNFVQRYKELDKMGLVPEGGFDVIVHYEVIEHMKPEHGMKMLKACRQLLKKDGVMLMSTPCYDGVRHAANHIHEYTIAELETAVVKAGFKVIRRFGTFIDIKHIGKVMVSSDMVCDELSIKNARRCLEAYFDNDAISCIFAPLYPNHARNNLWVCGGIQ